MPPRTISIPVVDRSEGPLGRLLPVLTTAAAALLSLEPLHVPGFPALAPAFTLMAVYHWTIYRPKLLPPMALFLIGVAHDLLAGAAPGATALLLLVGRAVVLRYRRYFANQPFSFVWSGFALLTAGALLAQWILYCLLASALLDLRITLFRALLTIFLFPIGSFLLARTQRTLMGASRR